MCMNWYEFILNMQVKYTSSFSYKKKAYGIPQAKVSLK